MHDMPDHDEEAGISANFDGRTRTEEEPSRQDIAKVGVYKEISKEVLRKKLVKMRHLVIKQGIQPRYLDALFPSILEGFEPQVVNYNGGRANIKEWKISCYLEVMSGGVPCTNPNIELKSVCQDLLDTCNLLFAEWYRQQHACNRNGHSDSRPTVERLMTFITRYTPAPGEQALLKHVDGAGKVDGSVVVALPIDRWSAPGDVNSFEGYGGGLTFWDGKTETGQPKVLDYDTRSGDIAFIDR
mmetsp:Transcript_44095/g.134274  ORF Transcript_44095/g.134274 Transcript_44095/m.134274 type:complete len:242 (+) Transcript_44095:197-922(+)